MTAPAVPDRQGRSLPDVWAGPATGIAWCVCGEDHPLTEDEVAWHAEQVCGGVPDRLVHEQVVQVAADVWQLEGVCRFFRMRVEDAAVSVAGHDTSCELRRAAGTQTSQWQLSVGLTLWWP